MELVSPLLRTDFREFCVTYLVLRQINDIFTMAGVKRGSVPPDRVMSGQRRTLVEEYYASINWERPEDVERFLKVLGYAIAQQYTGSDDPRQRLRLLCEREGLLVDGVQVSFKSSKANTKRDGIVGSEAPPNLDTSSGRPLKVFLCHTSSDKQAVRELYDRLITDGFSPWLDEKNLIPGQDWRHEITTAVRASDVVVVCLSKSSITKEGYVQKEIRLALDVEEEKPEGTIFIIPLRLEQIQVPDRLERWHWVNLFDPEGYGQLVRALKLRHAVKH